MARGARRRPSPPANSVVASAVRLGVAPGVTHPNRPSTATEEWQNEGWYFLDTCGELAFAAGWFSNALSRVRLYVQRETADGTTEVTSGAAYDAFAALGDDGRRAQIMAALGTHMFVPGECFLVGYTTTEDEEVWDVYSTDEVKQQGTGTTWIIDRGDGEKMPIDTDPEAEYPAVVIRIWRSHPRRWVEATSPVRAVLPVLRELEGLTKHIGATIDSRLAGAGILAVPSEMTFSSPLPATPDQATPDNPGGQPDPSAADQDKFLSDLGDAMLTPIKDRGNASAVVPIVIRAPGALLGGIKHFTMDTPLDEKAADLRSECIRRLALGLDMPPEVLLGTGDVNHWGAWQIDEAALKTHIEPACELLTSALTTRYLVPILEGQGVDATGMSIQADTSDLRLRPNRTEEAFRLYDLDAIDLDALLRETGFGAGDKPDPTELQRQLLLMVARSGATPDLAAAALAALGVPLDPEPSTVDAESPPPALSPAPAPDDETDIENRREPPDQAAALLAAAEPLVARAVERARNKMGRGKPPRPVPESRAVLALAAGAFDRDLICRTARRLDVNDRAFGKALIQAAMIVLVTGVPTIGEDDLSRVLSLMPQRRALRVVADG